MSAPPAALQQEVVDDAVVDTSHNNKKYYDGIEESLHDSIPILEGTTTTAAAAIVAGSGSNSSLPSLGDLSLPMTTDSAEAAAMMLLMKPKRLCQHPGCNRVIKSQGRCQRHGAKAKRCRVDGCDKQAQGTHDGCCKKHWKLIHCPHAHAPSQDALDQQQQPPEPEGHSVYDTVLPKSIGFRPSAVPFAATKCKSTMNDTPDESDNDNDEEAVPPPEDVGGLMPLVLFLREGASKQPGWHRNAERRARGLFPVRSLTAQLEPWERQLALVEILLLSGGTPYANFKDLSHAWGRERGFHHVLASSVCERRGEVERKRRSDASRMAPSSSSSGQEQPAAKQQQQLKKRARTAAPNHQDPVKPQTEVSTTSSSVPSLNAPPAATYPAVAYAAPPPPLMAVQGMESSVPHNHHLPTLSSFELPTPQEPPQQEESTVFV